MNRELGTGTEQPEWPDRLPIRQRLTKSKNTNTCVQILKEMREGNKVRINGKQHQFNGHQQNDQVFPVQEKANHADAKKHHNQHEEM